MQQRELMYGVRNLKHETATQYLDRKDREFFKRLHQKKARQKQFWKEFAKTHPRLEA